MTDIAPVTVAECLRRAQQLSESESPRLDVEVLLAHILNKDRTWLYTWPEKTLSHVQRQLFDELFERRRGGEPVAYLTGVREFWSLQLKVSPATLIPRPETELLVETALSLSLPANARILDLGTGTGAIALALASEKPGWQITAVDCVDAAVELATENAHTLALDNVCVLKSDWFENVAGEPFDLIISNPPYIDPDDRHLTQGDVRFEPKSALVAAQAGLGDLVLIAEQAVSHLQPGGWLLMEHGFDQGGAVAELMQLSGYTEVSVLQDLSGCDRAALGRLV